MFLTVFRTDSVEKDKYMAFLCHRFSCVTRSDFLEARSIFCMTFCIRGNPLTSTFANSESQDEMQHNKLHFTRLYTACIERTVVGEKEYTLVFFRKLQPDTLDM